MVADVLREREAGGRRHVGSGGENKETRSLLQKTVRTPTVVGIPEFLLCSSVIPVTITSHRYM